MKDRMLYGILGFLLGGLVGGYLVGSMCGREYRKRIEELTEQNDELVAENKKSRERALAERQKAVQEAEVELEDDYDPFEGLDDEDEDDFSLDYEGLSRRYKSDDFNRHFETRVGPSEDDIDFSKIRLITGDEFAEDVERRDNETLTYYQEEGVLVDSTNEVIENEERYVGPDAMEKVFDTQEDFVYVSNDIEDKMYEIVVEHDGSFYRDAVQG